MFTDLQRVCASLITTGIDNRVEELAQKLPSASIYALGGFPFLELNGKYYWNFHSVSESKDFFKSKIKEALGLSAILTYTNPKNKQMFELGNVCVEKNHFWAYNWLTLSIVLARHPLVVELAFAHDTRFQMSWPVQDKPTGQVIGITGTLSSWKKFTRYHDDTSFDKHTRKAMLECHQLLSNILPENLP